MRPDYYETLGLDPTATSDEIKEAYRKLAKKNHPDTTSDLSQTEEQVAKNELMININLAYEVLSDPGKRAEYDRLRKTSEGRVETRDTSQSRKPRTVEQSIRDLYDLAFGNISSRLPQQEFSRSSEQVLDHILISDTDLGLLYALREAYRAKQDGKWVVKKAESDRRDWMPNNIYIVKREGNKVITYRIITDWRNSSDRNSPIRVRKENTMYEYDNKKTMNSKDLLHEYYLRQDKRSLLEDSSRIPGQFEEYLNALKGLAFKLKDEQKSYEVYKEVIVINEYARSSHNIGCLVEEGKARNPDKELIRKVLFTDFFNHLQTMEGRVAQVEGQPKSKEGHNPSYSDSSESKA